MKHLYFSPTLHQDRTDLQWSQWQSFPQILPSWFTPSPFLNRNSAHLMVIIIPPTPLMPYYSYQLERHNRKSLSPSVRQSHQIFNIVLPLDHVPSASIKHWEKTSLESHLGGHSILWGAWSCCSNLTMPEQFKANPILGPTDTAAVCSSSISGNPPVSQLCLLQGSANSEPRMPHLFTCQLLSSKRRIGGAFLLSRHDAELVPFLKSKGCFLTNGIRHPRPTPTY